MLTDTMIDELIREEKIITVSPSKNYKDDNMYLRKNFELCSIDGSNRYSVFMRKHKVFHDSFSLGLRYLPIDSQHVTLLRMNGKHGSSGKKLAHVSEVHYDYHIHTLTEEDLEKEVMDPIFKESTDEYVSFEQAIDYFCRVTNIRNYREYFPFDDELTLFPNG